MAAEVSPGLRREEPIASPSPEEADAAVHPPNAHAKPVIRWGYFVLLNAIAGVIAVALFVGIQHGEALDPYMIGTYQWLMAHPMVTSAMAFSPLAASMLVGWGYSQRARKRKAAAAAALERSAAIAQSRVDEGA
ncbi:MAG: hypothetical protein ABI175_14730 [Polyangiales bacterium]